ncbi:hypothetical protein ACWU37_16465 [Photobacterium damselae subsp. damselae]
MTKSEIFKAAHKLAKAYKVSANNCGDYVVYLSLALKNVIRAVKKHGMVEAFRRLNAAIKGYGKGADLALVTFTRETIAHVDTICEEKRGAFFKALKNLKTGQSTGKTFERNGNLCAYVYETRNVEVAY